MKLICPNCKARYDKGKFCLECGTPLVEVNIKKVLFCPVCQTELKKGKFCPECGSKLEEREVEISPLEDQVKSSATTEPDIEAILTKYRDEYGDMRTLNQEEYGIAAAELQLCASKGNPEALCFLSSLYIDGHGVAKDIAKAYDLLCEAESKGSKYASAFIGIYYLHGWIVEQDYNEAMRRLCEGYAATQIPDLGGIIAMFYLHTEDFAKALEYAQLSADKDSSVGLTVLGHLYLEGYGVEQNYQLAFDYYMQAAAQGEEEALNQLGWMYMNGCGVDEDPEQAFFWYNESAQKNSDVGMYNLGFCYSNGYGVDQDEEKAAEWYKKSADAGYSDAMLKLGEYYRYTLIDDEKAKMWIKSAADLGNVEAINQLGVIYCDDEENFEEAVKCFNIAADKGFPNAYRNLAICYRDGKGVKKNIKKSKELLAKATELGIVDAAEIKDELIASEEEEQLNKAISLMNEGKLKEGCALFRKLGDQGNPKAQRYYGRCLLEGAGIKQDLKVAVSWLEEAAKRNDSSACLMLAEVYLGTEYHEKSLKVDVKKAKLYLQKAYDLGADPKDILPLGQMTVPSVEISNIRSYTNVNQNGHVGVEVVFKMSVQGMVRRKLNITAYCIDENGNKSCLKKPGRSSNDPSECKFVEVFNPIYSISVWDSYRVFVPYSSILNSQKDAEGTMVVMAWDQTDTKPKLLACEEFPYRISCKTHIFSSNEWTFRFLRQESHKKLVKLPKLVKYELPKKTGTAQSEDDDVQ